MTHLRSKLVVAGLLFVGAVGYLAYAGMQKGWVYTLSVDNYLNQPQQQKQRVRLCGIVGEKDLQVQKAQLSAIFYLQGETKQLAVAYKGIVPDLFKPGSEVLVEGKRDQAGVFQADLMMTKCASKYDEAPKGHPKNRVHPTTVPSSGGNP